MSDQTQLLPPCLSTESAPPSADSLPEIAASADPRASDASPVVRFLDAFLQEKNIKWLLGIGALLVLASSLRLVVAHWDDYPPVWKYLVFVSYTAAIFIAGEVSYWRLSLRKTGAGLMALTVLLLPISFMALHWVQPIAGFSLSYLANHGLLGGLLLGNATLAYLAARRIFKHFLRGHQPTFLASYLILCIAGAVLPAMPGSWTPIVGLTLWAVLTAGVVKVNRHVFWLVEEHRLPRICGFFPIGLLTGQFIALAGINLVRFIPEFLPTPWLGLALTLAAVPVLLATDAVAKVFEQRTGGLVRPFPWSVGLPLGVSLSLVVGGVCLAATGMPRPYALPPTALIAAGLLAIVARRAQKPLLAWTTLAAMVVAYNFSPLFFQELASAAVHGGATAICEARLPYAFYGLTYLPLLVGFSLASKMLAKRGDALFAEPLRKAAAGLAIVLLLAAWGHSKAMFPVGVVTIAVFALQTAMFRRPLLIKLGIAALVTAGVGWAPFADSVLGWEVGEQTYFLAMAAVSGLLLLPGHRIDALYGSLSRRHLAEDGAAPSKASANVCRVSSLLVAALATVGLLLWTFGTLLFSGVFMLGEFPYLAAGCLCGLLVIHAIHRPAPAIGEFALASPLAFALAWTVVQGWSLPEIATAATVSGFGLWLLSYLETGAPRSRVIRAFAQPARRLSLTGLLLLGIAYYGPSLIAASMFDPTNFPWLMTTAMVAWCFDAARRASESGLAAIGCLGALGLVSAAVAWSLGVEQATSWHPVAWAGVACLALPAVIRARTQFQASAGACDGSAKLAIVLRRRHAVIEPMYEIAVGVLCLTAIGSLASISVAARVAGGLALIGLGLKTICEARPSSGRYCLLIANWQILALTAQLCHSRSPWIWNFRWGELAACSGSVALCAAISQLMFEHPRLSGEGRDPIVSQVHASAMRWIAAFALAASLTPQEIGLSAIEITMAALSFAALAARQLLLACREASEERVWQAEAIVAAAIGYFALRGVIPIGQSWSMFALLGAGVSTWGLGQLAKRRASTAILARPLMTTGMVLPLGTVALAVFRHIYCPPTTWHGMNSLSLLLAAGFYFWRGVERRSKRLLVAAAAIVNVALALLWRELSWSDPQLFMIPAGASILLLVELLKRETPESLHNPLRYFGALVILVSPTFHIVGGSWTHLLTLMIASVAVALVSIGLRVRALMYTGAAFLLADLVAMLVRGSVDRPNLLWIAGVALGGAVIALAAFAENHREVLLQRLRLLAAGLNGWE